jgi:flavorubredoxin
MKLLAENVYTVGVQDWDRRLFDELIPLPDGTSYNAYLSRAAKKPPCWTRSTPQRLNR